MISVNSALKVWKAFYCEGKWHECARYKLSTEGKPVPSNLLPNGKELDLEKLTGAAPMSPAKPAAPNPAARRPIPPSQANPAADLRRAEQTVAAAVAKPAAASAPKPSVAAGPTASYYLRISTNQTGGVMTEIIRVLGQHKVKIDAMTEKRATVAGEPHRLIVLTDQVAEGALLAAIADVESLSMISGAVKYIPLERI
jgi:hypothetical protein